MFFSREALRAKDLAAPEPFTFIKLRPITYGTIDTKQLHFRICTNLLTPEDSWDEKSSTSEAEKKRVYMTYQRLKL
jgi:hypothetical protein